MDGNEQQKPKLSLRSYWHGASTFGWLGLLFGSGVSDWRTGEVIGAFIGATIGILFVRFAGERV